SISMSPRDGTAFSRELRMGPAQQGCSRRLDLWGLFSIYVRLGPARARGDLGVGPDALILFAEAPESDSKPALARQRNPPGDRGGVREPHLVRNSGGVRVAEGPGVRHRFEHGRRP